MGWKCTYASMTEEGSNMVLVAIAAIMAVAMIVAGEVVATNVEATATKKFGKGGARKG